MRTVINHRVYDSATAELVYTAETPAGCETLYRKRTGEYFLLDPDYQIAPLSYNAAEEWADEHMPIEAMLNEFDSRAITNKSARVHIIMNSALYARLVDESRRTGRSKTAIITDALEHALK